MSELNDQKIEQLSKKKYVRLTAGNVTWRDESGFNITELGGQKGYCETSKVPADSYTAVNKAVAKGLLEFINKPSEKPKSSLYNREAPVSESTGSFEWTESPDPSKAMKTPSFTGRTLDYKTTNPLEKQAFKVLADTPKKAVAVFSQIFSTIDNKNEKIKLAQAIYKVERGGHNPAMAPRAGVIDYISDVMLDLGIKTGISSVQEEREPVVKDSKPLRFAV
jgi:hypothetical protein